MSNPNVTPSSSLENGQAKDNEKGLNNNALNPDIKGLDKLNIAETYKQHIDEVTAKKPSDNLNKILHTSERLKQAKACKIEFSKPILQHNDNAVIFPNTINVIQGQAGVHKSRLAETICAALIKLNGCTNPLLNFKRMSHEATETVVYVDTERNLSEQLPYSLQSLQLKAGYQMSDHPLNYHYVSLLEIDRKERFEALNEYLAHLRTQTSAPMFIVLDVSTDCIEDFNKTDKSMQLIDLMNLAINEHKATFLCLIHENPKSDKARGHFGTELMNKASTVIQVGFEKDASQNDTNIIRVKFLKCRNTEKFPPFYVKFCPDAKGLVSALDSEVAEIVNNRKHKANNASIIEHLQLYLDDGSELARTELIDKLSTDFGAAVRTIETRLKEITEDGTIITNAKGENCILAKEKKVKKIFYSLKPLI